MMTCCNSVQYKIKTNFELPSKNYDVFPIIFDSASRKTTNSTKNCYFVQILAAAWRLQSSEIYFPIGRRRFNMRKNAENYIKHSFFRTSLTLTTGALRHQTKNVSDKWTLSAFDKYAKILKTIPSNDFIFYMKNIFIICRAELNLPEFPRHKHTL